MRYIMGKEVRQTIRETFNGHIVAELNDNSLGFGLPGYVGKTHDPDTMISLLKASKDLDTDDFETFIESLYMAKLIV